MTLQEPLGVWPGLASLGGMLPAEVTYERGVWGKAPGARTDYRWLAKSPGFVGSRNELERKINLGVEDEPRESTYWRSLPDGYYAVGLYPGRGRDETSRGGFSEKQVLALTGPSELPAALAALVMLPHVATLDDGVWWSRHQGQPWLSKEFSLPVEGEDHAPLPVAAAELDRTIQRGIESLREQVSDTALAELYAEILAGRTAWLRRCSEPLSAEALAVLLLPLPAKLAAGLSLAGWIPSSRVDLADLRLRWSAAVEPVTLGGTAPRAELPPAEAKRMAKALLTCDPSLLPRIATVSSLPVHAEELFPPREPKPEAPAPEPMEEDGETTVVGAAGEQEPPAPEEESTFELDSIRFEEVEPAAPPQPPEREEPRRARPRLRIEISEVPSGAPEMIREIHAFASDALRWRLTPEMLKAKGQLRPFAPDHPIARRLKTWVREVEAAAPEHHREHWKVKVDLLRAVTLALVPDRSTLAEVGRFQSGRVPPLLFGELLGPDPKVRNRLIHLGEEDFRNLVEESWNSPFSEYLKLTRSWLIPWRQRRDIDTRIRNALEQVRSPES